MIRASIRKQFPTGPESAGFALDLDFETSAGVAVLFGSSGAGKTLTLDCIAGFVRPDDGRILLDDDVLFDRSAGVHLAPQARRCGYVFQNYALFPHMTLRENLEFAAARQPASARRRRVAEMLEQFHLAEVAGRKPHELSGGQKQRCSIARALIGAPRLLLLDEPARGLDAPLRAELYGVLRQVRADFATPVLLVSHDLEECFELGDEMLVMSQGRLVQAGSPRSVLEQPANVDVARLLGVFNLLPAEILALDETNGSSRVRLGEFELDGPSFPGRQPGDHVFLFVRPEALSASARNGKPGPNQIPARLTRTVDRPRAVRLEFSGGIAVDMPPKEFDRLRSTEEWVIGFPVTALRAL